MRRHWLFVAAIVALRIASAADVPKASDLAASLQHLALDAGATFRVRDLVLERGEVKLYLTEGVLSFFAPLNGRVVGAVFTAMNVESGDGELLMLPPIRSERASLASFIQRPNLDEHLRAAVFFFSDDTALEIRRQIAAGSSKPAPELLDQLNVQFGSGARNLNGGIDLRILQSLLDSHAAKEGFFFAALFGRTLPAFTMFYDPQLVEPVTVGQTSVSGSTNQYQVWATYRPRRAAPFVPPPNRFSDYRIDTNIRADLTLDSKAEFTYRSDTADGRTLRFEMSERLRVLDAAIDGIPVEVFQRGAVASADPQSGGAFLLVAGEALPPGMHRVAVRFGGGVIRQTASGTFFVDDRTSWFPYSPSLSSTFDLTFHCPDRLRLVSTGELVSEETKDGIRTVHRRATAPRPFAGFNLGRYSLQTHDGPHYRVEVYSDQAAGSAEADISQQTERILEFYTKLWNVTPLRTLAISPIAGYFGQGFPGLVYLSDAAYLRPENRAPAIRNSRFDVFLNRLLLPHEIAHQWWGNLITSSTYRAGWLVEALANYSALQYLEAAGGKESVRPILIQYRADLLTNSNGSAAEATGPLDWGSRLLNTRNPAAWQTIVYGKGVWVLEMLRQRLGDAGFIEFERQLLTNFRDRTFTDEDVAETASKLLPATAFREHDRDLRHFFETWIFNTGIPKLRLRRDGQIWLLDLSDVDDSFSVDVPVRCGHNYLEVRATKGENYLPKQSRGASACTLPDTGSFLYTN